MSTAAPAPQMGVANEVRPSGPSPTEAAPLLSSMTDVYSLACLSAKFRYLVEGNYASVDESAERPVVPQAIDTCYAALNLAAERLKCAGMDRDSLEAVSHEAQLIRDRLLSDWLSPGHRERLDARAWVEWPDPQVATSRLDRFTLTNSPFDPAGWTVYEYAILRLAGTLDETRRDLFALGRQLAAIRYPLPSTYDDTRGELPALDIDLLSRGTAREIATTIHRLQERTGVLRTVDPWLSPDNTYESACHLAEVIWHSLEAAARQGCPESDIRTGDVSDRSCRPPGTTGEVAHPHPTDGAGRSEGPPRVCEVGQQGSTDGSNNGTPPACQHPSGPWWHKEERTLYNGDLAIRTYVARAENVIAVLDAFEAVRRETGTWPARVQIEGYEERQLLDAALSANWRLEVFVFKKSRTARTIECGLRPAPSGSTSV